MLDSRGYNIEFGTLEGQEHWAHGYDFISRVHILGAGITKVEEEQNYLRMTDWHLRGLLDSWNPVFDAKKALEATWHRVFLSLVRIMEDPELRPDFILADYLVEAARDISHIYGVPIATHWPQMPTAMLKNSYTPGVPGLSVEVISSEHATFWQRLKNELMLARMLPPLIKYKKWRKQQRAAAGLNYDLPATDKPDHLLLVNSFFGLTPAIDTPPNVANIGPVLGDHYDQIQPSSRLDNFMRCRERVLYISMGTHALLRNSSISKLLSGACLALSQGEVDGIVWSIRGMARAQVDQSSLAPLEAQPPKGAIPPLTVGDIFNNAHPHILVMDFAPQRAILSHSHTKLFVTHGGASSTNEACYHGVAVVCLGIYFDQLQNGMRLRDAGLGVSLDHHTFTAKELASAICEIMHDTSGKYRRNVDRIANIAKIGSRRKALAADLIEEALADFRGRVVSASGQVNVTRPPHLQTADMRMPWWKRKNVDLKLLTAVFVLCQGWVLAGIPIALGFLDRR